MFMHAMPLGRLAESHGWKPGDLARSLGVRFRRGEDCSDVLAQAIHKGDDPMWLEEFIKQSGHPAVHGNVRRTPVKRSSRSSRGGSRKTSRSSRPLDPSVKRVGSPHQEHIRDLGSYCYVCGYIDEANPKDPLIREWHSDSFGNARRSSRRHGNVGQAKSRLDVLLDSVKPREHEVTIDADGYTPKQVDRIYAAAKARGLHVSGTRRWILIRDLRGMRR